MVYHQNQGLYLREKPLNLKRRGYIFSVTRVPNGELSPGKLQDQFLHGLSEDSTLHAIKLLGLPSLFLRQFDGEKLSVVSTIRGRDTISRENMEDSGLMVQQIGVIRSPYQTKADTPRQGRSSLDTSVVELFPRFAAGLDGIDHCRYLYVLWWANKSERDLLHVVPPGETEERGVFSTRSPARPNPLGLSLVRVVDRNQNRIRVQWLDAMDGTPLIDLKPYSHGIDCVDDEEMSVDC